MIKLDQFPQLRQLAWNCAPDSEIDDAEALALYERNWKFVDVAALEPEERALLDRLIKEIGQGILNV